MRRNILFLPASIRSHVVPTLYLADQLAHEYDIYVAVTSEVLKEIVVKHGYNAVPTSSYRVCLGMEGHYLAKNKKAIGKWAFLKSVWRNDLFAFRQKELSTVIEKINPAAVLIDIFNSTDILVLFSKYRNINFLFVNPMLSTYRVNGFPTVDQGEWPLPVAHVKPVNNSNRRRRPFRLIIRRPLDVIIRKAMDLQFKKLTSLGGFCEKYPVAKDRTSALLFENIPEIILAPMELEISREVRKSNQYYLGLCITENRKDTELDISFDLEFDKILQGKNFRKKLIYCTFGTFYDGSDSVLMNFLNRLLDALEDLQNIEVILSVNKLVIETLKYQRQIPLNIHMYSRVPQLKVLQHADVFVTHGGLGSIKESIFYEVPMLVYPLDLNYDQNGNGFKVEHHGLGLRGVFKFERSADMRIKIEKLMNTQTFKQNIKRLKSSLPPKEEALEVLKALLNPSQHL